jgi:hypothetical protein
MTAHSERLTLLIPVWNGRRFKLHLPPDVAHWLHDQLAEALDLPRPPKSRRPVRLKRGQWTERGARR